MITGVKKSESTFKIPELNTSEFFEINLFSKGRSSYAYEFTDIPETRRMLKKIAALGIMINFSFLVLL